MFPAKRFETESTFSDYATDHELRPNYDKFGSILSVVLSKMKTKQAKDFLVRETTEQAGRENTPLSDVEKRMMYFTESDTASCDNPVELNDEFEALYDMGNTKLSSQSFSTMLTTD